MFLNTIVLRFEAFRGAVGCQCRTMSFTHVNNDFIKRLEINQKTLQNYFIC